MLRQIPAYRCISFLLHNKLLTGTKMKFISPHSKKAIYSKKKKENKTDLTDWLLEKGGCQPH